MQTYHKTLQIQTSGKGTTELTGQLKKILKESDIQNGLLVIFCRHTSCSLVIMENADPSARKDLEAWLDRQVPEKDTLFTHTLEGPDDMPSHIKMALTRTSETIPVVDGELVLGTWQGCFLWEHRSAPHRRSIQVTLMGEL